MENQHSTSEIIDHIGRSDLGTNYHADNYDLSDNKAAERIHVAEFISSYFCENEILNVLSMPGMGWYFEHRLAIMRPRANFIGLERSATAFLRSRRSMPNATVRAYSDSIRWGEAHFELFKTKHTSNRSHYLLNMSASAYTRLAAEDYRMEAKQRQWIARKLYRRNAVWLDFTGGFCADVDQCLVNLPSVMMPSGGPVVITLMYGRDVGGLVNGRLNRIGSLLPGFSVVDHWVYRGKSDTPMLTVCGEWTGSGEPATHLLTAREN